MEGLRAARPYLQRLISDELTLKRTPTLEFVYDGTIDQGMRIQAILQVQRGRGPGAGGRGGRTTPGAGRLEG